MLFAVKKGIYLFVTRKKKRTVNAGLYTGLSKSRRKQVIMEKKKGNDLLTTKMLFAAKRSNYFMAERQ